MELLDRNTAEQIRLSLFALNPFKHALMCSNMMSPTCNPQCMEVLPLLERNTAEQIRLNPCGPEHLQTCSDDFIPTSKTMRPAVHGGAGAAGARTRLSTHRS